MSPPGPTTVAPSPPATVGPLSFWSGTSNLTSYQCLPWSSVYQGYVPPDSTMRPVGVAPTYVSQQLPPAGEMRQAATPILRPRASYTGYDETRTFSATSFGVAPLEGIGPGP